MGGSSSLASSSSLPLLRGRDLAALTIFLLGVYISLSAPRFKYNFQPAFYLNLAGGSSGRLAAEWDVLPPVVADIDGDGELEMVFISPELSLGVYSMERPSSLSISEIYAPTLLSSVPLKSVNLKKGRAPILLKTGFTTEASSLQQVACAPSPVPARTPSPTNAQHPNHLYHLLQRRHQVIVVVREDLTVTCYDSSLNVVWEKAVTHHAHALSTDLEHYMVDEASMLVSPLSVTEESEGMVVVGTSFVSRSDVDDEISVEENVDLYDGVTRGEEGDGDGDGKKGAAAAAAAGKATVKPEHFSVVCLDAKTGKLIWKHDGMEVHAEQYTKSLPQHAYKTDIHDLEGQLHRAPGVSDWNSFRTSLMHQLPHVWDSPEDTEIRLAKFVRRHVGAGAHHQGRTKHRKKGEMKSGRILQTERRVSHGKGAVLSGTGKFSGLMAEPNSADPSVNGEGVDGDEHPNVLVAHTSKGLEVISLLTGAPITSLALAEGPTYGDLDGDGLVDSLHVLRTKEDALFQAERLERKSDEVHHCSIMALSGLPPRAQLFNSTVCPGHGTLTDALSKFRRYPDVVGVAPPLVLRTTDARTRKESKVKDVVTAINSGTITSVTGQGTFNWQIREGPTWELAFEDAHALSFDTDAYRAGVDGTHNNRFSHIVVTGQNSFALLSREGDVLATSEIPHPPVARPVFVDFNGDGLSDVIIMTDDAVLGYKLEARASVRSLLVAFFALALVAVVMFLSSIRDDSNALSSKPAWSRFGTKRSTDATFHLD